MLDKAVLEGITARYASFAAVILNGAGLRGADLRGVHLREAEVNDDRLEKTCLISADLTDTEIQALKPGSGSVRWRSNVRRSDRGCVAAWRRSHACSAPPA